MLNTFSMTVYRAVGRSENFLGQVVMWWSTEHNTKPPVEIGLTDLPKSGVGGQ